MKRNITVKTLALIFILTGDLLAPSADHLDAAGNQMNR